MASFTTRLGLTKPAGTEARAVGPLNTNADLLDKFLPCILVNDGVTPPTGDLYDGALVKERTSGIIWEARKNGGGTYDKVYVRYPCFFIGYTLNQSIANATTYSEAGYSTFQTGKNSSSGNISGGKFVVPVKGIWMVNLRARFAANATGQRGLSLSSNGSVQSGAVDVYEQLAVASGWGNAFQTHLQLTTTSQQNVGTALCGAVWQNSGGALNCDHSATYTLIEPVQ